MVFERGIQVYLESDALGEYLTNRLVPLMDQASTMNSHLPTFLSHRSTEMNKYFTMLEQGIDVERPGTGVPPALRDALRTFAPDYPRDWVTLALAVMSTPRKTWRAWKHFREKTQRRAPFRHPRLGRGHRHVPDPHLSRNTRRRRPTSSHLES